MIAFTLMIVTILSLTCASVHAAELETVLNIVAPFLSEYAVKYPLLGQILHIMVMSRLIVKPLMTALLKINESADLRFLDPVRELSGSKIYKSVAFILDWLLSIKLPKKK